MEIYERIKQLRLEKGWTQTDLALRTGYSDKSSIAKLEKGIGDLTASKVSQFAKAFGVSSAYLIDGKEEDLFAEFTEMDDEQQKEFLKRVITYMELMNDAKK